MMMATELIHHLTEMVRIFGDSPVTANYGEIIDVERNDYSKRSFNIDADLPDDEL